jgi:PKD repeat protein
VPACPRFRFRHRRAKTRRFRISYTDASASGGATYYYEVQPVNEAGVGPFSSEALAAPPSTPPLASFHTSCAGATCSFTSTSTDAQGTIDAYAWNGGNGATGSKSTFSDAYAAQGTYTVTLTVTNTAGQSSAPASETVTCSLSSSGGRGRHSRSTLACN